jgi:DUF971 family protein
MKPINVTSNEDYLIVQWDEENTDEILLTSVRWNCPCAYCSEARKDAETEHFTVFHKEELTVEEIIPVGNYAIKIRWGDGHDMGIYTFELLKKLAEEG